MNTSPHRYVTTPRPRDMASFGRAEVAGSTPQIPPTPPRIEEAPTSQKAFMQMVMVLAVTVACVIGVVLVGQSDGHLSWLTVALTLGVAGIGAAIVVALTRRWGQALMAELQHGYTTMTFTMGAFWFTPPPEGTWTLNWVEWDWRGTWVLRADGEVVSEPSDAFDPPGLYPSPRREGALELWTGHQWTNYLPQGTPQV